MTLCACKEKIEQLRQIMESTFDKFGSFTNPSVLAASQTLDDALVQYRKCPFLDLCNCHGSSSRNGDDVNSRGTRTKRIAG